MTAARPTPNQADPSAGMLLTVLGRAANRLFTDALRPLGLKPRHLAALAELRDSPLTQQTLGERTGTDPTKLVGLLNDLERWSLIVRRRCVDDRRRHMVEISPGGRERLADVDRLIADADRRLLDGLGCDEQATLLALLAHVATHGGVVASCPAAAAASEEDAG